MEIARQLGPRDSGDAADTTLMNVPVPIIKGWCPGALRPMPSGDGLIVRLKLPPGVVDTALAQQIAQWSHQWGNGVIELSARANLQLRGVSHASLGPLQSALSQAHLLDHHPQAEAVRNITLSPLSDRDPDAILNLHQVAQDLDHVLRTDTRLHSLPGKFGFAIDASGAFAPGAADITFVACRTDHGPTFAIRLAEEPAVQFGPCHPDKLIGSAVSLALAFLSLSSPQAAASRPPDPFQQPVAMRRMRDLVAQAEAATVAAAAGLSPFMDAIISAQRSVNCLGPRAIGTTAFLGLGLPFGQMQATDFTALLQAATAQGARDLRLTPYRAIFIPLPSSDAAQRLTEHPAARPFILNAADPRRRVAACPGAPACLHASTPVRLDAAKLASALAAVSGPAILAHVSGCEKGCAHPTAAPITLTARDGYYDLVRNGTASAQPVLRRLTLAQAIATVTATAESPVQ